MSLNPHLQIVIALMAALGLAACSPAGGYGGSPAAGNDAEPGGDYERVSDLVELPDFIPGMGTLFVQPGTLPVGPFLAHDRNDEHVSTVYMIPLADMNDHAEWTDLEVGGNHVDSVDVTYNPGHPGVEGPHYHVTLWHVPSAEAALE